jgi:hypothetical protein
MIFGVFFLKKSYTELVLRFEFPHIYVIVRNNVTILGTGTEGRGDERGKTPLTIYVIVPCNE